MQSAQVPVPGISSRRLACDRCRTQKLACQRDSLAKDKPCERCSRAGTKCVTSPIFRMRNLYQNHKCHTEEGLQATPDDTTSSSSGLSTGRDSSLVNSGDINHSIRAFPDLVDNTYPTPNGDWDTTTGLESLEDLEALDLWNLESSPDFFPLPDHVDDSESCVPLDEHGTSQTYLYMDPRTYTSSIASPISGSVRHMANPSILQSIPSHLASSSPRTIIYSKSDNILLPPSTTHWHLATQQNLKMVDEDCNSEESYVKGLDEISADLSKQFHEMKKRNKRPSLEMLISTAGYTDSFAQGPATRMLNTTRVFLDLLGLVVGGQKNRSHSFTGNPKHLSTEILLSILTCYIRILQLYTAHFSLIEILLRDVSESDEPSLRPIPGLDINNFTTLTESGNLQTNMFVQITINLFERMEHFLGLPRDFRINRRDIQGEGLLDAHNFTSIARMVLEKIECEKSENGIGGIHLLRLRLKNLSRMLQERIAP